jgi:A/G-specific adenine glycosylase
VLLERRPANGVWGGLWSFPELDEGRDAREHCLRRLGCRVAAFSELHAIQHGFTHFRLRIRPLLGEAVPGVAVCDAPGPRWWNPRAAAEGAVPAPVRRLLQGMAGSS